MPSLKEICSIVENSQDGAAPLRHACAVSSSKADLAPLPEPHDEAVFDSSWELLLTGAAGSSAPAGPAG